MKERRRSARYEVELSATMWLGAEALQAVVRNVSFEGMFLTADVAPPLLRLVQVELVLPNRRAPIRVSGMGVHRTDPDGGHCGLGLRFIVLEPEAKASWTQFVLELERRPREPAPRRPSSNAGGRRRVKAASPELRVAVPDPKELRALAEDILAGRELLIETTMQVPLETSLWVTIVSPTDRRAVSVASTVVGVYADASVRGVAVVTKLSEGERRALAELADAPQQRRDREASILGFDRDSEVVQRPSLDGLFDRRR